MKVSIRDIAKDAEVSITTVSRFLNNDYAAMKESTRKRIEEVIRTSGYVCKPKTKVGGKIGIVLPDLSNPFFAQIVQEVEGCTKARGYELLLCITRDSYEIECAHIQRLLREKVAGIVYMSTVSTTKNCFELLKEQKMPFVVMDSYLNEYNMPAAVFTDGKRAMYELTGHLLENGHRDIAYISGLKYSSFGHNRYQGYVNALLEAGVSVNPDLVRFCGFDAADGSKGFQSLYLSGIKFTAVVCESDMIALGVGKECRRHGLQIPDDISITGFDNTYLSEFFDPPITSVEQPASMLVRQAMEMLEQQMNGETITTKIVEVTGKLIVRDSVKNICAEKAVKTGE